MDKNRLRTFYTLPLLFILGVGTTNAVQLETGKWEITMQSRNPMTGEPISKISTECIEDSNFDPSQALMNDGNCRVTDKQENSESLSWKIECGGNNMPAFHGEGRFVSRGKSAEGEMTMTMTMGANTMEMNNKWTGRHISSKCDGM